MIESRTTKLQGFLLLDFSSGYYPNQQIYEDNHLQQECMCKVHYYA